MSLASSPYVVQPQWFGATLYGLDYYAATNRAALCAAIEHLQSIGGGVISLPPVPFYIDQRINITGTNIHLIGMSPASTIIAAPGFEGASVTSLAGISNSIKNVTIDANILQTRRPMLGGIQLDTGSTDHCVIQGCIIKDASFCGIWMTDKNGLYSHDSLTVSGNRIQNVGWEGITVIGAKGATISNNRIERTGYNGIMLYNNDDTKVLNNYVTKATPPDIVYSGQGSLGGQENGFLIGYGPECNRTLIQGNICIDNRNAGGDGIGLGENGQTHGSAIITGNFVSQAGTFGIDVAANATVTNNVIEDSRAAGIFIGLDLGGPLENAVVANNRIKNCNDQFGIDITTNLGNPMSINNLVIDGNIISDTRSTQTVKYGIRFNRDNITASNISINNNTARLVGTAGMTVTGSGVDTAIRTNGNNFKGDPRAVASNGFYVAGCHDFSFTGAPGSILSKITGGYEGMEIKVVFNIANTTLKPDWGDTLGFGANRIVGNSNIQRVMNAGDVLILKYREGVGWLITSIVSMA